MTLQSHCIEITMLPAVEHSLLQPSSSIKSFQKFISTVLAVVP